MRVFPMFPLGTVLFPHMVLPLHVFEPRYRVLMHDLLSGDREFGVTLISRGHEVGGGDVRTDVGTVARLLQAEELEDGRWLALAVGTRRVRVERWLTDDPYPRADVADLPDLHDEIETAARLDRVLPRLRRVLAMQSELGEVAAPSTFERAQDSEVACWQAAVMAPLTPHDAQQVLVVDRCDVRLDMVERLLREVEETSALRLRERGSANGDE